MKDNVYLCRCCNKPVVVFDNHQWVLDASGEWRNTDGREIFKPRIHPVAEQLWAQFVAAQLRGEIKLTR